MNWSVFIVLVLGGLALFLHGMTIMTDGLKAAAGSSMKNFLKKMTYNRWTSLVAGTGITAVIQSSSITTVLAVGFVSAGLISFQSTLGIILGANIGTTITAQIIAFKVTHAAWIMIASGYLISLIFSKKALKETGTIILGLGLVFLGMNVMSEATEPLKTYNPFIQLMLGMDNYFWGILIGTLFTAAIQSSSATTGVVIILASQGLISTDAGISIIFGANIGTCVTAILSAIGKPREAMRVAVSHILFKIVGVLIWVAFIDNLAYFVELISSSDKGRQIANAHTFFNVGNTFLFIWLTKPVSKLILFIIPDKKKDDKELFPELHEFYLDNSPMALEITNKAISKLGEKSLTIIDNGIDVALHANEKQLSEFQLQDDIIDQGQREIVAFLQKIQSNEISVREFEWLERQIEIVNILELASDLITTNLVETAQHRLLDDIIPSDETVDKLTGLYKTASNAFHLALKNYSTGANSEDKDLSKADFKNHLIEVREHLLQRLSETGDKRIKIYRFESDILEIIRQLHALARRINRKT